MKNIWFSADLHLGHFNLVKYDYSQRPFKSIEEMDDTLISNWNKMVRPDDTIYFLGDFALASKTKTLEYRKRLNGKISVVEGNHDKSARQIKETFESYQKYLKTNIDWKGEKYTFILSHYLILNFEKAWYSSINLGAHSHGGMNDWLNKHLPNSRILDIGIDSVAKILSKDGIRKPEDYRPISIDEVLFIMKDKTGPCKNLQ